MAFDPSCIDVRDFLECLDVRNITQAADDEIQFSCPYSAHARGDEHPSAYMNTESTAFLCHSCHAKGDAVTFASDILGVSPIEAIRMLKLRYSPGGVDPVARNMVEELQKQRLRNVKTRKTNKVLQESVLEKYIVDWRKEYREVQSGGGEEWARYIFNRGFSPQTLSDWDFGYSWTHKRITLPIRDEQGRLVGIKARATDNRRPKYLNLRDDENGVEPFLKNDVAFGLDRVVKQFRHSDIHLIVVEGEWNAVAMHAMGWTNTVAINGSYFGERQIKLIIRHCNAVTLFFDSDSAGYEATEAVAEALRQFIFVNVCPDHRGDPAEMHANSVAGCLQDRISYLQYQRMKEAA